MTMRHTPASDPEPRLHLTEVRILRKWSQQEVADRIGTTHVNVSRWERGITRPSPYFRRKLCQVFGKTEEELDLDGLRGEGAAEQTGRPPQAEHSQTGHPQTGRPQGAPVHIMEAQGGEAVAWSAGAGEALYDPAIPLQPAIELVGRDRELAQIRQRLLGGGSVALTALNGLPGVGKTALSITLAHDQQVRAHFRDGVLWAGLGPTPNLPGLLSRWGTLLGMSATEMATLSGNETWARALHTAIGARRMLLVIDDAWRIEEALTFKVGGSHCVHLVTTRFPAIASHLAFGGTALLQELGEAESMTLLRLLAPGVVEREPQQAQDLVHAVGGLPLALTLMGNYLRKQAYTGQARRIHTALERLSSAEERLRISEPHGPVESHPSLTSETPLSLQSVFAVTDQLLSEEARAALYALSAFPPKPNSFSEEAALVIAACSVETLDALSDSGLLESSISDRYTLHQTIADYA
ncbi:MAG: NB-ARC domain-containing protein, partial [Ktedonobacteraceae bacterium]